MSQRMQNSQTGRRMNNRNGFRNGSQSNRSLMRELNGHKLLPQETPPVFVGQPWNNMVLIIRKTAAPVKLHAIKVESVRLALRSQGGFNNVPDPTDPKTKLGLDAACHFDFRIKSFAVWATDRRSMSMMPMELTSGTCELARIDSNAQANMYARAGYKLPLAQSSITISTSQQPDLIILNLLGATSYEVHISILWKGADTALPALTYAYPSSILSERISQIKEDLRILELEASETSSFDFANHDLNVTS